MLLVDAIYGVRLSTLCSVPVYAVHGIGIFIDALLADWLSALARRISQSTAYEGSWQFS